MGMILFFILVGLEAVLAVRTLIRGGLKRVYRRDRLIIHLLQAAAAVIFLLLPYGQRWRFLPVLAFLVLLLVIAVIALLIRRNQDDGRKSPVITIIGCIFCILLLVLFMIPAFVFTGYKGLPVSGGYQIGQSAAILIDKSRTDPFEPDGSFREVPVHFYYPKNAADGEKFPLVIFSHGAFGYYQSNTSTYMELASNGYVVAALDHHYHAFFTEDTNGRLITVDPSFSNAALHLNESVGEEEQLDLYRDWMALRTADMGFALDEIKSAVSGGPGDSWFVSDKDLEQVRACLAMTDTQKIGLMGHSMGGATSVALGRNRDDITAVIDIDGTMLSEYTGVENGKFKVNTETYAVPVLEFINWETYNDLADYIEEYRAEGGMYPNDELMRHAVTGFSTTIRDTKHMDFTDLPLLSPVLADMLGSGSRDKAETMTIVNSLVLQFFDCYLKGEGTFGVQDNY